MESYELNWTSKTDKVQETISDQKILKFKK